MTAAVAEYNRLWWPSADGKRLVSPGMPDIILVDTPPVQLSSSALTRARGVTNYTDPGGGSGGGGVSAAAREALVPGVDRPTLATAGCIDRSILTEIGGAGGPNTSSITYSGGTASSPVQITDKWFTTAVYANGFVDFRNCQFISHPTVVGGGLDTTSSDVNQRIRVYDSDFICQNPLWDNPALKGWRTEIYRCYFKGHTDGFAHLGKGWIDPADHSKGMNTSGTYTGIAQNVTIQQCLIEKGAYRCPDPGAVGGPTDNCSHLDVGWQIRGGDNFLFFGNDVKGFLDPTICEGGRLPEWLPSGTHYMGNKYATATDPSLMSTSAHMYSPILGQLNNLRVIRNWMDGGAVLLNFAGHTTAGPYDAASGTGGIQVIGNRFGPTHRLGADFYILANTALPIQMSLNVKMLADGTVTTTPANTRKAG